MVLRALRMKKLAGDLCMVLGGRHTHPVTMKVGGFSHLPTKGQLEQLRARLKQPRADVDATVELFQPLKMPDFERETEYIALRKPDEYAFIGGTIASTDGVERPVADYREVTNEHLIPHSTAKHTRHKRDAYMVGALARFNVNHELLHPKAKAAAEALGLKPICTNPYMNTVAQVVEIAHCIEDGIQLIDTLLARGIQDEVPNVKVRAGKRCRFVRSAARHPVPRVQRRRRWPHRRRELHHPDRAEPGQHRGRHARAGAEHSRQAQDQIRLMLEMLVRAYDPCISCSTHMLDVKFE